jgi:hypothetical protein
MMADNRSQGRVPQPLMHYTQSMVEPTGDWKIVGDYAVWSGNRLDGTKPYVLHELVDSGVLPVPTSTARAILHPIKGGVWFHIQDLFGFWMRTDVDTVWIDAPGNDGHYYTLIIGGAEGRPGRVAFGWVCPKCATPYNRHDVDVSGRRFQSFFDSVTRELAHFNSNDNARECPSCRTRHPQSYGFMGAGRVSELGNEQHVTRP